MMKTRRARNTLSTPKNNLRNYKDNSLLSRRLHSNSKWEVAEKAIKIWTSTIVHSENDTLLYAYYFRIQYFEEINQCNHV